MKSHIQAVSGVKLTGGGFFNFFGLGGLSVWFEGLVFKDWWYNGIMVKREVGLSEHFICLPV